jgi:lysine 2,3-aminomutase
MVCFPGGSKVSLFIKDNPKNRKKTMQELTSNQKESVSMELDKDDEPPSPHPQSVTQPTSSCSLRHVKSPFPKKNNNISTEARRRMRTFRKQFFPGVTDKDWNSWHWQVRNRIASRTQLESFLKLSFEEQSAFNCPKTKIPLGITPYYMSLLPAGNPDHPLRRTVVPTMHEFFKLPGEENDPLGEEAHSPLHGLVHRYPDRVLLLLNDFCAAFCRYCTRSRMVGRGNINAGESRLEKAIEYIRNNPAIRDVLLSGGDPLTLSDKKLEWILSRLRDIPHVEIIRIGSKVPAVLPQRVTPQLVRILKKYHPLWMSLHFTHPDECTPESFKACKMLADAGIPLGSQTVLLKGINDNVETMKSLMQQLMKMRVKPYYLYQCDPVTGTGHFRTSVDKGLEIIRGLRGHTSGYAVPNYVIDAPGGGGKIPLMHDYVLSRTRDEILLCNYEDKVFTYPLSSDTGNICSDGGI